MYNKMKQTKQVRMKPNKDSFLKSAFCKLKKKTEKITSTLSHFICTDISHKNTHTFKDK